MPSIGDLHRGAQRSGDRFAIAPAAITRDDVDAGMSGQPSLRRRDLAIRKQRHDLSPLQIADNRAIAVVSPKSPIIDAGNRWSLSWRPGSSPHDAQKRVVADRNHQSLSEAGRRPAAKRQAQMVDNMFQPRRSTRPRRKHGFLEALSKNPPRAISSRARKPPRRQAEANALSRKGQVSYVAHVAAVDPARDLPANGTIRLADFGPGRHDHRFANARHALRDKPVQNERETPKIASHGADSPKETAQTRH
jgi:hypothetical protein